jgi:diacylglycerol O-acyltransferase 1
VEQPEANGFIPSPEQESPTSPITETGSVVSETTSQASSAVNVPRDRYYKHLFAVHSKTQPSTLSHEAEKIPSFLGFRNLMVLSLVVSNLRLVIENYQKYGVLICIRCHDYRYSDVQLGIGLFILVPVHLFIAFLIELVAAHQAKGQVGRMKKVDAPNRTAEFRSKQRKAFKQTWRLIALAHTINATSNLLIASLVVYYGIHHPGIGTLCEIHAVIVWLKTCSYAFTNRDLRHAMLSSYAKGSVPELYKELPYPQNITVQNLTYFWWAPTLLYQPVYPRTEKVRWSFVFKRLAEVVVLSITIWILSAQYASPLLKNSLRITQTGSMTSFLERLMKLSTVSVFCWLAGFFALFHSFLNALAEILRFGDREFYSDWWNAPTIRQYWTMWNKPVYNFMRRHIYAPLVGRGVPPPLAQVLVFFFSGALHELLVGVPTHNILGKFHVVPSIKLVTDSRTGYAFAGMMFQIPLIFFTDWLIKQRWMSHIVDGHVAGNLVFWISFCLVGQPLAAMRYFWAWQAKYGTVGMGMAGGPNTPVPTKDVMQAIGLGVNGDGGVCLWQ